VTVDDIRALGYTAKLARAGVYRVTGPGLSTQVQADDESTIAGIASHAARTALEAKGLGHRLVSPGFWDVLDAPAPKGEDVAPEDEPEVLEAALDAAELVAYALAR
jgi:hypothetical protein